MTARNSLGILGLGAFGELAVRHLAPHFTITAYDPAKDLTDLAAKHGFKIGNLADVAMCDIVMLAIPVQKIEQALRDIAPLVKPGALIIDVASVKVRPAELMQQILPDYVEIIGTHPLFGPQSGKDGIQGLNIAICPIRSTRMACVSAFLQDTLKLNVMPTTPQEHDRETAYVQGLTHLLAKVVVSLDLPKFRFTTKTYDYMDKMVEMVRHDSDDLFKAIARENPFAAEAKKSFFDAARKLEEHLEKN